MNVQNYTDYLAGYYAALEDVRKLLQEERENADTNSDPVSIWWARYFLIMEALGDLPKSHLKWRQ